jgi:hypothetical protein
MTKSGSPGELSLERFSSRIASEGLGFDIGPFRVHIRTTVPHLYEPLHLLYADFPLVDSEQVFTLHADIVPVRAFPWLNRSRVRFVVDLRRMKICRLARHCRCSNGASTSS